MKGFENNETGRIRSSYGIFYEKYKNDLGYYFYYLYNIGKFIADSNLDNKEFYANLLRSQLSYDELTLIFYHCLSIPINNKFKPIIEDFCLFKNLPRHLLIKESHGFLYKDTAWTKEM